jgi:hypothetical protein
VSSRKQGTAALRAGRRHVTDWEPSRPPLDRVAYIPKPGWLEILAGDNPDLRNGDGRPMATVIGAAAGLDRTTLAKVINGRGPLTAQIVDALTRFLEVYRGYTEAEARDALFQRVTAEAVAV